MIRLLLFGAAFGFANSIQSRVLNNGTKERERFPDWLLFLSVLIVAAVYSSAMRAVAVTTGFETIAAYSVGQALGVVVGARIANGPLYDRLHGDRHQ